MVVNVRKAAGIVLIIIVVLNLVLFAFRAIGNLVFWSVVIASAVAAKIISRKSA